MCQLGGVATSTDTRVADPGSDSSRSEPLEKIGSELFSDKDPDLTKTPGSRSTLEIRVADPGSA